MSHYKNFKTVVYIPAQVAASFDKDRLEQEYRKSRESGLR